MTEQADNDTTHERPTPTRGQLFSDELDPMAQCQRCGLRYQPAKSTSSLRLTYCSFLCELGDLGFSLAGLEHMEVVLGDDEEQNPEELGEPAAARE